MSIKLPPSSLPDSAIYNILTFSDLKSHLPKKGSTPLEHAMNALSYLKEIKATAMAYAQIVKINRSFSTSEIKKSLLNFKKSYIKILNAHTTEEFLICCIREKNFSIFKASIERHRAKGLSINATSLLTKEICSKKDDPLWAPFVDLLLEIGADPEYTSSRSMSAVALATGTLLPKLQAFIATKRAL